MLLLINTETEKFYPLEFFLKPNEPNPFADKTKIKYCVAYKTKVTLMVLDNDGNVVEKLISKEQDAGVYEIEFIADGLAEGIYYYQIIAGNYSSTKKMELNKKAGFSPQHSNKEGGNCL
jgi:Secretion system C-terminal sorting domain